MSGYSLTTDIDDHFGLKADSTELINYASKQGLNDAAHWLDVRVTNNMNAVTHKVDASELANYTATSDIHTQLGNKVEATDLLFYTLTTDIDDDLGVKADRTELNNYAGKQEFNDVAQ